MGKINLLFILANEMRDGGAWRGGIKKLVIFCGRLIFMNPYYEQKQIHWTILDVNWILRLWGDIFHCKTRCTQTVKSCKPLEIFESIVTDEIIDHVATNSNLYATQSLGNKDLVIKSHPDCIDGKISLLLKFDCILQHWYFV